MEQNVVSQAMFWYEIWSGCYKMMVNISIIFRDTWRIITLVIETHMESLVLVLC